MTEATPAELMDLARRNVRILEELAAEFEVSRGSIPKRSDSLRRPEDAAAYYRAEMGDLEQEQMRCLLLDRKSRVIGSHLVYQGTTCAIHVSIKDLFREAVRQSADAMIIVHNHPSGDTSPSPEDIKVTKDVIAAGQLLDIEVTDHLIVGTSAWVSLREHFGYL